MGHKAQYRPQRLAAKLLQIRRDLGLSQSRLAKLLDFPIKTSIARVSEYENGVREPGLTLILRYARIVGTSGVTQNRPCRVTSKPAIEE